MEERDLTARMLAARDNAELLTKELGEQLELARERIGHLELALQTNRQIAMAIGILMARRGLTEDAAFGELRAVSQRRGVKLREVAAYVVEAGDVPVGEAAGAFGAPEPVESPGTPGSALE